MRSILIAVDSVVNVLLGLLLLIFPPSVAEWLGLPLPSSAFYVRILGAVILGIGVALAIEFWREPSSSLVGLGPGGAIAINLCGGGALVGYLVFGDLSLSTEGTIVLWILAAVVIGLGLVELVANLGSGDPTN
ncbi:MAG: hypothetical protein ACN4G0_11605 [Polyangiales bacterium]